MLCSIVLLLLLGLRIQLLTVIHISYIIIFCNGSSLQQQQQVEAYHSFALRVGGVPRITPPLQLKQQQPQQLQQQTSIQQQPRRRNSQLHQQFSSSSSIATDDDDDNDDETAIQNIDSMNDELKESRQFTIVICSSSSCSTKRQQLHLSNEYVTMTAFDEVLQQYYNTTTDGSIAMEATSCLGCCHMAPCVGIQHDDYDGTVSLLVGMTTAEFQSRVFHRVSTRHDIHRIIDHSLIPTIRIMAASGSSSSSSNSDENNRNNTDGDDEDENYDDNAINDHFYDNPNAV